MVEKWIFLLGVVAYVAAAAFTDIRMHRIPNYITVPSAVLGLAFHLLVANGFHDSAAYGSPMAAWWQRGLWSLLGFLLGFAVMMLPFVLGGGGAGDVKLAAALGAWLGPWWWFIAFAISMITASAIALFVMATSVNKRGVWKTKAKLSSDESSVPAGRRKGPKRIVPFSVPVAVGTLGLLLWLVANQGMVR